MDTSISLEVYLGTTAGCRGDCVSRVGSGYGGLNKAQYT